MTIYLFFFYSCAVAVCPTCTWTLHIGFRNVHQQCPTWLMNYCESDDNSIKFILQIEKLTIWDVCKRNYFKMREKNNYIMDNKGSLTNIFHVFHWIGLKWSTSSPNMLHEREKKNTYISSIPLTLCGRKDHVFAMSFLLHNFSTEWYAFVSSK